MTETTTSHPITLSRCGVMHETQGPGQTFSNRTPSTVSKTDMSPLSSPALRHRWNLQEQPLSDQFRQKAEFPSHVDYLWHGGSTRETRPQLSSTVTDSKVGDLKEVFKYVQQVLSHSVTRASAYWKRELKRLKAIVIFLRHLLTRATFHQSGRVTETAVFVRVSRQDSGSSPLCHSL